MSWVALFHTTQINFIEMWRVLLKQYFAEEFIPLFFDSGLFKKLFVPPFESVPEQWPNQMFLGHSIKIRYKYMNKLARHERLHHCVGWSPKIFDIWCLWGIIFVSLYWHIGRRCWILIHSEESIITIYIGVPKIMQIYIHNIYIYIFVFI